MKRRGFLKLLPALAAGIAAAVNAKPSKVVKDVIQPKRPIGEFWTQTTRDARCVDADYEALFKHQFEMKAAACVGPSLYDFIMEQKVSPIPHRNHSTPSPLLPAIGRTEVKPSLFAETVCVRTESRRLEKIFRVGNYRG